MCHYFLDKEYEFNMKSKCALQYSKGGRIENFMQLRPGSNYLVSPPPPPRHREPRGFSFVVANFVLKHTNIRLKRPTHRLYRLRTLPCQEVVRPRHSPVATRPDPQPGRMSHESGRRGSGDEPAGGRARAVP